MSVSATGAAVRTVGSDGAQTTTDRVLATIPTGVYFLDREWRFTYINPEAERLVRRTAAQLVGQRLWEAFPAAAGSIIEDHYRRAVDTGMPVSFETYYPEPLDGWYEVRATPGPEGLSVYFLEVTERHRAQQRAEAAGRHLALLARVSRDLAHTVTTGVAPAALPQLLVPSLADGCAISVHSGDGAVRSAAAWHDDERLGRMLGAAADASVHRLAWDAGVASALTVGRPVRLTGGQACDSLLSRQAQECFDALPAGTVLLVPVRHHGRELGRLTLGYLHGRPPTDDQVATLEDLAGRLGLALDNARLYSQQRDVAAKLQRSLLAVPGQLSPDRLEVATRYLPAVESAAVGGDWYDVLSPEDGSTMVVIGDVAGHDVTAATMGQLRGLVRGIALARHEGPADVLGLLDRAMVRLGMSTLATAIVGRVVRPPHEEQPDAARLEWSCAGHPPAAMVTAGGDVSFLGDGHGDLLLGLGTDQPRRQSTEVLPAGATLVLYTDGLVERRREDLDEGLMRLRRALGALAHRPLAHLCDSLLQVMVGDHPQDDVALVAVRLTPGR